MTQVVALYSPRPGCGKSALAQMLVEQGMIRVSFASTLKHMLEALISSYGFSPEDTASFLYGAQKDEPIPGIFRSGRYLMETLGTSWGKDLVGKWVWIGPTIEKIKSCLLVNDLMSTRHFVVVDDVRFPEELTALKNNFRTNSIYIYGRGSDSGTSLCNGKLLSPDFDEIVHNDGDLANLREYAKLIYARL